MTTADIEIFASFFNRTILVDIFVHFEQKAFSRLAVNLVSTHVGTFRVLTVPKVFKTLTDPGLFVPVRGFGLTNRIGIKSVRYSENGPSQTRVLVWFGNPYQVYK